jgi:osmotically-inducible protein OsmY
VVRLTGEVSTLSDKVRAATIARSQTGVRAVEEDLKVER